ncbi:hypothetical protein J7T55_005202 [Diaporthe amygdali]|uniref:uncharacterized protein n=1 Tax=Phomopsis amygdali TaxID=1214568 RepID=UPI0022FF0443|nr:uncharacterized protein J7T55_005202 [Diaporthe amygdali]KAJ0116256.1 hypothetical protein J7T55_005202 [Diaporthe amygdali]
MPDDAGGRLEGVKTIDGLVRVSYEDEQSQCSIEALTFDATEDNIRCIEGGCGVSDITDSEATVTWGGCWLVNQNYYDPNVALKDTDCIPMKGTIRFKRNHGDTRNCGSVHTQEVTLHNQNVGLDTILNGRNFIGGTEQTCSTLHA